MDPRISVRNGNIFDDTKDHITQVCTKLDKFCDRIIDCEVVVDNGKQGDEVERRLEARLRKYHDK